MSYRKRTLDLETVKHALGLGYKPCIGNKTAIRRFVFVHTELPKVIVSWFRDSYEARVTVGDTTTNDRHAVELLRTRTIVNDAIDNDLTFRELDDLIK